MTAITHPLDLSALVREDRVHRSVYVDRELFEREMVKVFGGAWVYLAHDSEVARPNDFKTTRMGLRPLVVTRDDDGQIHALFNRCSHRAAAVCVEERGNAKRFQCPYHGWTYANSGKLLAVPFPQGYGLGFDKESRGLHAVPRLDSYRGFIFGSLNPAVAPLSDWLGPAAELIDVFVDRSPIGRIDVRNRHHWEYRGNWKLAWDNAGDGLHPTFAHRSWVLLNEQRYGSGKSLSQFKHNPDDTEMYGEDLGNGHIFVDQRPGNEDGSFWKTQRPFPGRESYEARLTAELGEGGPAALEMAPGSFLNLSIFPNLLLLGNQLQVIEPLAVDRTRLSFYVAAAEGAPDEVNVMRMRIAEDFSSIGNADDFEIYERCHDGLQIPEIEWIDTSKGIDEEVVDERGVRRARVTYDTPIRGYLREWLRLMSDEPELTTT